MATDDDGLTATAVTVPSPVRAQREDPADAFDDLETFKLAMKEAGLEGAQEQLATVQVRKPPAEDFVRVHPDKAMTIPVALHEGRDNFTSEYYVVLPKVLSTMMDLRGAFYAQLHVTVTPSGTVMLWPVKLPTGGAGNPWYESALRGAEMAKNDWIRIFADPGQKQYRLVKAPGVFAEPAFPDKSLNELLKIAFKGRVIDSDDHPICRRLRGEV
jgi:hypothetical protein